MRTQLLPALALLADMLLTGCVPHVRQPAAPSTLATSYTPAGCDYTVSIPPGVDANETYYPAETMPASTPPIHVHASFPGDPSQGFAVNWAYAPPPAVSGSSGTGGMATFTVSSATWMTNQFQGSTLTVAGEQYDILSNTDTVLTLSSGTPANGAWAIAPYSTDIDALQTELLYGTYETAVANATGAGNGVTLQWGHTARYASPEESGNPTETRIHEVHVCGLQPGTTYYYKVGNPGAFSRPYAVTTAPAHGSTSPISFAFSGGARANAPVWGEAEQDIQSGSALFQLFGGDAVSIGLIQTEWDTFFAASNVSASIPIMPASGSSDELSVNYVEEYALPQNPMNEEIPQQSGKAWYSFDYGNAHFTVLDDTVISSDTLSGVETTWLNADLSAVDPTKTPWKFVVHYQADYSCDTVHGSDAQTLAAWGPLFDKYHVDFVFSSNVHNYQRSFPLNAGNVVSSPADGTIYIVSGSVGAPEYSCQAMGSCSFSAQCSQDDNYVLTQISGTTLTLTAYDVESGAQIDAFSITK